MNLKNISLLLLLLIGFNPVLAAIEAPVKPVEQKVIKPTFINVKPLELVNNPTKYLNQKVLIDGKFDKFTTLGLDYKKAYKDSSVFIGFLLQRDDVKNHNIPLSELKLFVKRDYAEKFIDLNTGDKISLSGTVFSNALGDAWVNIETIEVLEKAPKTNQK